MIGSAGDYIRMMKLSMKWKYKQKTGNNIDKQNIVSSESDRYQQQLEQIQRDSEPSQQAIFTPGICGHNGSN